METNRITKLLAIKFIKTNNEGTIRKAMDDAFKKADSVIFWWGRECDRLKPLLRAYRRNAGYYRKNRRILHSVYYFDSQLTIREIRQNKREAPFGNLSQARNEKNAFPTFYIGKDKNNI